MKNIIIISAIAAIMLGAMGGGFYLLMGKIEAMEKRIAVASGEEDTEGEETTEGPRPTYSLKTLIVNLADKGGRRYLRSTMDLELARPGDEEKVESRLPSIKDATLKIMSTRSFAEINSIDGKNSLRDEIVVALNEIIKEETVTNVFFTEFVVQ